MDNNLIGFWFNPINSQPTTAKGYRFAISGRSYGYACHFAEYAKYGLYAFQPFAFCSCNPAFRADCDMGQENRGVLHEILVSFAYQAYHSEDSRQCIS
jgi:hypothetical protein